MPSTAARELSLNDFRKELKAAQKKITKSFAKLKAEYPKAVGKPIQKSIDREIRLAEKSFKALSAKILLVEARLKGDVARKTERLKQKAQRAEQLKAKVDANNLLLEIKRKDLLGQSAEIESAYEKISKRNSDLVLQKRELDRQAERLREKNEELESRAESLLDQTEYLHEANQTITRMHAEMESQKDEILKKNDELLTLNTEKNNLIGIVAHDLKSPLNQIKGLVSLIRVESNLEGEAADCLTMIESSANRLSSMISKILDIEAIESRYMNLNIEPINLMELLIELTSRFGIEASQKQIQLHNFVAQKVVIETDRNYLTQILENLLSNAIKFSPSGKNIYLRLTEHETNVLIEVQDEGPGMTDDDKKKLFGKYQKLSAKPTGSESSTGLGLSIVKKFTESMQGKIGCESEAGKGARFFVELPKKYANQAS